MNALNGVVSDREESWLASIWADDGGKLHEEYEETRTVNAKQHLVCPYCRYNFNELFYRAQYSVDIIMMYVKSVHSSTIEPHPGMTQTLHSVMLSCPSCENGYRSSISRDGAMVFSKHLARSN